MKSTHSGIFKSVHYRFAWTSKSNVAKILFHCVLFVHFYQCFRLIPLFELKQDLKAKSVMSIFMLTLFIISIRLIQKSIHLACSLVIMDDFFESECNVHFGEVFYSSNSQVFVVILLLLFTIYSLLKRSPVSKSAPSFSSSDKQQLPLALSVDSPQLPLIARSCRRIRKAMMTEDP